MVFHELSIPGAYVIDLECRKDDRGFFARFWCEKEFSGAGLINRMVQGNTGLSIRKGTLRGMHFQLPPHEEAKLVRVTRGRAYDVVLDLRPESRTFLRWQAVELGEEEGRMVYVPVGCAHGYQTLDDQTELMYMTSSEYAPSHARGVRYDDPAFSITWPLGVTSISEADRTWPDFIVPAGRH